jgi:hypothetical protein
MEQNFDDDEDNRVGFWNTDWPIPPEMAIIATKASKHIAFCKFKMFIPDRGISTEHVILLDVLLGSITSLLYVW